MKILKVIVSGNTRVAFGKRYIEYTPNEDLQMIVGTNGCGKSSLMRECTLLPPDSSDYIKGGYKYVMAEHNGNRYEARSDFGKTNTHSFIRNGVELNKGGTLTIQKELIKQETGLTQEIHDVMTDRVKFTDMSSAMRRHWITMFCPTDLTYANQQYNLYRSRLRDTVGAINHLAKRLSVETNKLLEFEDVQRLETYASELREELNVLMQSKDSGLPELWKEETQLSTNLQEMEETARAVMNIRIRRPQEGLLPDVHDLRDVEELLSTIRQEIGIKKSMLAHYSTEYSELDSIMKTLTDTGMSGVDELEERLADLVNDECGALANIKQFLVEDNPEDARDDSRVATDSALAILEALPTQSDNPLTLTAFNDLRARVTDERLALAHLQDRVDTGERRLAHVLSAKETTCPKCSHAWKEGVSDVEVAVLEDKLNNLKTELKERTSALLELETTFEAQELIVDNFKRFHQIVGAYPRLKPLWEAIVNAGLLNQPREAIKIVYEWIDDIHISCTLRAIRQEKEALRSALEHTKRLNQSEGGVFIDRVKMLQTHIETNTEALQVLRERENRYNDYYAGLTRMFTLKGELVRSFEKVANSVDMVQRVMRDEMLSEAINRNQNTLALVQSSLNEKNTIESVVRDLQSSYDKLLIDREAYSTLVDMLSPTDGIIAEQLLGAVHSVVVSLNSVIASIWTYDLIIQDCGTENGELDYKLPMIVIDELRKDVSEGSSSILDIVNFAFKVLMYNQLDLQEYPLYLDELGRTFDPEHLQRTMQYIQSLLHSRFYSQVFMISHFENYYDGFANAELLVLDSTNVNLSIKHNEHVIIQ